MSEVKNKTPDEIAEEKLLKTIEEYGSESN